MNVKPDIVKITTEIVNANTAPQSVVSVTAKSSSGSLGEDVLRISVQLVPKAADMLRNDVPLNILFQLQDRLFKAGEERFPVLDYATPDEIATPSGDH
jgi:hypothetical protein